MDAVELRAMIVSALRHKHGPLCGQITSCESMPLEDTGTSVGLRITGRDPSGDQHTYLVLIAEV